MTEGVVKTRGTRMFFARSDSEIHKVACATGISGLGGAASQIDKTCLDSEEDEFEQGNKTPGPVSVPINLIPRSAAHQALEDLFASGEEVDWMIVLSDQASDPTTVDTDGHLVSPGATTVRFRGFVQDFPADIATNDIVRVTMTIQRSGAREWNWPTADLA